jgi:hypothetical protein
LTSSDAIDADGIFTAHQERVEVVVEPAETAIANPA